MSQEVTKRKIDLRDVSIYTLERIIAGNKFGLTVKNLIDELLLFSRSSRLMPYFGPGWTLNQVLDDYVKQGKFKYGTLTVGANQSSWIGPTDKFKFESDEAIEKVIEQNFVGTQNEVIVRDKTPDSLMRRNFVGTREKAITCPYCQGEIFF